ncbi:MAG: hypothetical protein MJ236_00835 [Clostridia bacterium]|nr:hypothetical protein [Clostridia bacterium]
MVEANFNEYNKPIEFEFSFDIVGEGGGGELPDYKGSYVVTPKLDAQQLKTKNTSMRKDVDILSIPVARTHNSYGTTITIA